MTPADPAPLEPDELRPIVDAWGGVEAFAAMIRVKPRTVESWLWRERGIKPPVAMLIRSLATRPIKKTGDEPRPKLLNLATNKEP